MSAQQNAMTPPPVDPHNLNMLMGVGALLDGKGIHEFSILEQRDIFRKFQLTPERGSSISVQQIKVNTTHGEVTTYLYKPASASSSIPFVYYVHGGGWILGSAVDWEEFIFDLVERTQLAVVLPEYTLAPEQKYPAQQEQCIEVLQHILSNGTEYGLISEKVVIASDSVGAQLSSALLILNKQRELGFPVVHQIMLHPFLHTTDTSKLIEMPLTNVAWTEQYYEAYFTKSSNRLDILASPSLMTEEQVKTYIPPTTIITSEIDGLRNQGEDFAKLLQSAGVSCGILRAIGCLHDVEIFHQARDSPTAELLMCMVATKLKQVLW